MLEKLSVMQGRVSPSDITKLQVFPEKTFMQEAELLKELSVDFTELLYDKEAVCKRLLGSSSEFRDLIHGSGSPVARSICLDMFADLNLLDSTEQFFLELMSAIYLLRGSQVKVLVLPFCDRNSLRSAEELQEAVMLLAGNRDLVRELDLNSMVLSLEVDLPAVELRKSLENVASCFGCCFDTGNISFSGRNPAEEILILSECINHVHLKDRSRAGANVLFGSGEVDFGSCLDAFRQIGYEGLLVLESAYFDEPYNEMKCNLDYIKNYKR